MSIFNFTMGGRAGLNPMTVDIDGMHLVNTAEAEADYTLGQVACLDWDQTSTETTSSTPGEVGSALVNLITPVTAQLATGTFLLALTAVAKGTDETWRLKGYGQARILNSGAEKTAGALCAAINSEAYLESGTPGAGNKLIFRLDETSAAADAGTTLRAGWFDGE